ncbi:MAG: PQQ-dependent sugar dehydrogenase, partial [Alphaproteobacteria bacterium]
GLAPNGDVFLAQPEAGEVTLLRDADGDGKAEMKTTFAKGFKRPHGIAFVEGAVLIADIEGIWSLDYEPGDTRAEKRRRLTKRNAFGGAPGNHWTRNIAVAPDNSALYVAIGSMTNISEEPEPHATVQRFDMDGGNQTTFTAGLRNPVGIAFYPGTNHLYVVVNERDGYGDGMVPDYFTRIEEGEFFGWPYAWLGPNPDPKMKGKHPDLVKKTQVPDLLFEAHSAPIGLVFYDRDQFPKDYRGDAFVALRGSWNSGEPTGYKVVRVKFKDGEPTGWYENFAAGFWTAGEDKARVWGRPAGLLVAADGSLLIADDTGGTVWRVSWTGE